MRRGTRGDKPLETLYPLTLMYDGVALFIACFTASGWFNIGFTGDRDSLPHLQRLAVHTGQSLEALEAAWPAG
ncbi:MAG TPA: WS/DGAT domain-containing protein [Nocardioidaceae bacterium]|nr:WS/DGAT domain-containing protein [Nocardioidaceae bacterium]